jgi:restriction endonuclease
MRSEPDTWELFDMAANAARQCPHVSVEMKTGTGKTYKTYMYLRASEADKVRRGQRHFQALGVPFAVAVSADEV